jgi:hypothetical protein
MRNNLDEENLRAADTPLWKELLTIKTNRRRLFLGIMLMVLQQWMGV